MALHSRWAGGLLGTLLFGTVIAGCGAGNQSPHAEGSPTTARHFLPSNPLAEIRTSKTVQANRFARVVPVPRGFRSTGIEDSAVTTQAMWFVADDLNQARVFEWTGGSLSPRSWYLGEPGQFELGSTFLAVAPNNAATWVESPIGLVEITQATDSVRRFSLPDQTATSSVQAEEPPVFRKYRSVDSLTAAPYGSVALTETNTSQVSVIDERGETASIPLPSATSAISSAFNSSGELAVGLESHPALSADRVLLVSSD